ncbi:hexosyltransferase [Haematococcus lacustris]|uniref:Hexosyltransferase n=1 Tax=Haematococcus lacustris TaxID=44745 RepID=A0A699ZC09_HAELA|nr:hexosyltransferase [Haematococcus lacustris]
MELVDAEEGYQHLWRKALVYLSHLQVQSQEGVKPAPDFVMHADDDSFH